MDETKITDADLKQALIEVKKRFLTEHREEIIRRAHQLIRERFKSRIVTTGLK